MKDRIKAALKSALPGIDFLSSKRLFDDGVIDSLALLTIVVTLDNEFGIEIDFKDLEAANFNSIESITALVEKYIK